MSDRKSREPEAGRRSHWFVLASSLAAWAVMAPCVCADLFAFKSGGVIEMEAAYEGKTVRLIAPDRTYTFLRTDFSALQTRPTPAQTWKTFELEAREAPAARCLELARWAWTHGLTAEAIALLRETSRRWPADEQIARLVGCLKALDEPWDDSDPLTRTGVRGASFTEASGPHVTLLHQHSDAEAAERVETLERVITTFYLDMADQGILLPPLRNRLVSVWFRDRKDYLAYLDQQGATAFRTTRGFHHPARGIVVTYDSRSDSDQAPQRETLAREEQRFAAQAGSEPSGVPPMRARELQRQRLVLDLRWRELDLGTAAHETVHQLVSQTRLAPRYEAFPIWLHEGLAMQYEPTIGGRWAGSAPPSGLRLTDYLSMPKPPPLRDLLRDEGLGHGYRRDPYAAAWSWVHYLRTSEPAAWIALLDGLRTPASSTASPIDTAARTLQSTGPSDFRSWEANWHQETRAIAQSLRGRPADPQTAPRAAARTRAESRE